VRLISRNGYTTLTAPDARIGDPVGGDEETGFDLLDLGLPDSNALSSWTS